MCGAILGLLPTASAAAVSTPVFADVSARGFSVVWASDAAVSTATVRVFADSAGASELTSGLVIGPASDGRPAALLAGVVRVTVSGLAPQTCVHVQTETTDVGTILNPPSGPFPQVCTHATESKKDASGSLIQNDLVYHDVLTPDRLAAADGSLVLLTVPGVSASPVSAFVGEGLPAPSALVDLNNVIDSATGTNAAVAGGELLEVTEFRGLHCPALQDHTLVRFRRAPLHEEVGQIGAKLIELELPAACFETDAVCDDVVDILDLQHVLNAQGASVGDCSYNVDLDFDASDVIDASDVQTVIDDFGATAPFPGP